MKRVSDYLQLLVVSLEEGLELGRVRDVVLDAKKGEVIGIVVEDPRWYEDVKVVPYSMTVGVGDDAVTIENADAVVSLSTMPEINACLESQIKGKGTKVITRGGRFIGMVSEYFVDTQTGKIEAYEISNHRLKIEKDKSAIVPSASVVTIGKDVLIVVDEIEEHARSEAAQVKTEPERVAAPRPAPSPAREAERAEAPAARAASQARTEFVPKDLSKTAQDLTRVFEERQRRFILGKKSSRKITAPNGEVIAEEGDVITEDVINRAREAGRFMELSISVRTEE